MKLADLFNPWARIARLEATNAALVERCEDLWERADQAEAVAFRRASEHYYQRSRMVEAQLEHTQKQIATLIDLTPPTIMVRRSPLD